MANNAKAQAHDDSLARFYRDNVKDPEKAIAQMGSTNDSPPERETMGPADLMAATAERPQSSVAGEVHGAMYSPQTTLKHAAAHEPGMPAGFTSAKNPQASVSA
jgi:hypothetical protein